MANHNVHRTLVDGGSAANILFRDAFDRLKLKVKDLTPVSFPVICFNGSKAVPDGNIMLPTIIGEGQAARNFMGEFFCCERSVSL